MTPIWSLEETRDEKIPPSAPACETNGGIKMSRTGTAVSSVSRCSCRTPDKMSRIGVSRMTAVISRTTRRTTGMFTEYARTPA